MDRFWAVGRRIAGCLIVACLGYALPLHAQYFGRNKVQYHSFNFDVLKTEHFDVYFYPAERNAAGIAGQMAERWYTRLSTLFDHQLKGRQPLILYASPEEFRETNAVGVIWEKAPVASRRHCGGASYFPSVERWATSTTSSVTS